MSHKRLKFISVFVIALLALTITATALATTDSVIKSAETTTSKEPFITETGVTEEGTPLDTLMVSYWPEYDEPSVLLIYRGTVAASVKTPTTLKIAIPTGPDLRLATVSAVDSNNNFQYDAALSSKLLIDEGDKTILTYNLIHPSFQFEIYMQPVGSQRKRNFDLKLPIISKIKSLSVDIKRPVRTENFQATPVAARTMQDGQFENHLYTFTEVAPGRQYNFNVTYDRTDLKPSVDKTTGPAPISGGNQPSALIIVIFVVALVGVAVTTVVLLTRGAPASASRTKSVKSKSAGTGKPKSSSGKKFCPACGKTLKPESKFCSSCGEDL